MTCLYPHPRLFHGGRPWKLTEEVWALRHDNLKVLFLRRSWRPTALTQLTADTWPILSSASPKHSNLVISTKKTFIRGGIPPTSWRRFPGYKETVSRDACVRRKHRRIQICQIEGESFSFLGRRMTILIFSNEKELNWATQRNWWTFSLAGCLLVES